MTRPQVKELFKIANIFYNELKYVLRSEMSDIEIQQMCLKIASNAIKER